MSDADTGLRVLVVDDDEASRYLAAALVSSAGHHAMQAVNGVDALEAARREPPDVVITDILMPLMDGFQLAREWKRDPVLRHVPLVFLTASYTDPADEKLGIELGADGFLSKPVDAETLLDTIERVAGEGHSDEVRLPAKRAEAEVLQDYTDRVVHKLEQKLEDLERANEMLENAMDALSVEIESKGRVIEELSEEVERRVEQERALAEERAFTDTIMATADVFIVGTDVDGAITLFGGGAERRSGYQAKDVIGRDAIELFAPVEERVRQRRLYEAVLGEAASERMTMPWIMSDGEQRIFEWTSTVLVDDAGAPTGVVRFGVDVTQRTITTAVERVTGVIDMSVLADRPASEILEIAVAQAADEFALAAVWIALPRDDLVPEVEALSGVAAPVLNEGFATGATPACPVGDISALREPTVLCLGDDRVPTAWARLAHDAGFGSAAVIPVRSHGHVVGMLGAVAFSIRAFDELRITALRQVADRIGVALTLAEARGRVALQSAALESAANAILIATPTGQVVWANEAFVEMTGWSVGDAVGSDLFGEHGYREPRYSRPWEGVVKGQMWRGEVRNSTKDGAEYVEDVTLAPVRDENGVVANIVIVKQDVSERVRLEQLKSDFVAMVSHELRTPLTTIIGYADLLAAGAQTLGVDKVQAASANIRSSGERMRTVVEQLLEVTEIQAEGVQVDRAPHDLGRLVREVLSGIQLGERHRMAIETPDDGPIVSLDARRVSHALRNVVDNAIKYSPEGGRIGVDVHVTDDEAIVAVTDEGVGMPAEQIPQLFEAFQQSDMTSTRSFGGTGVGLFVAYQFVEAHGGRITVRSRLGHGSTFELRLPLDRPTTEGPEAPA